MIHSWRKPTTSSLFLAAFLVSATMALSADSARESTAYSRASQAGVEIIVKNRHAGSGWIASREGHVLTANHVIQSSPEVQVLLPKSYQRATARLLAVDRGHDLALLKIDASDVRFSPLKFASRLPRTGDQVFLFGAPIFRHGVLMHGRLARSSLTYEYYSDLNGYIGCMHISAMAPRGVSGAPWLNRRGEVIGLQSGAMTVGSALYGIGFMIPLSPVKQLLNQATNIQTSTLGIAIEETWQQDRAFLDALPPSTDGLVILRLAPDGAAMKAGLKEKDIIVAVDGHPVRMPDQLLHRIRSKRPGETVTLEVLDQTGTNRQTVTTTLQPL